MCSTSKAATKVDQVPHRTGGQTQVPPERLTLQSDRHREAWGGEFPRFLKILDTHPRATELTRPSCVLGGLSSRLAAPQESQTWSKNRWFCHPESPAAETLPCLCSIRGRGGHPVWLLLLGFSLSKWPLRLGVLALQLEVWTLGWASQSEPMAQRGPRSLNAHLKPFLS